MSKVSGRRAPLREIARRLRDGTISARDLAEAACEAFRQRGPRDHAYATWTGEFGGKSATEVDRLLALGHDTGPFMGILTSIKDVLAAGRPQAGRSAAETGRGPGTRSRLR
jgi:aspartyl-tRNA(Asn)/glutamyl-tRNA(Gln) amidotransferase subunit A